MIQAFARSVSLRWALAVLFCSQVLPFQAYAGDGEISVKNVRFEIPNDLIYIYYDLAGPTDQTYNVQLTVFRESDSLFVYRPIHTSGDIGGVVLAGDQRRITWEIRKEFPVGLPGNDYYFVVEARIVEQERSNTLLWVGGGALVVGGVVALLLLSGGGSSNGGGGGDFPAPPGRP